jgi:hypothetical protein
MNGIRVRGGATAEEVAAVLAVVGRSEDEPVPDSYSRWREGRLAAVRPARSTSQRND